MENIEQVNNDYVDDDNYCYIDVYSVGTEKGKTVAIVDMDSGKVFFIDNHYRLVIPVIEAIKEVKDGLNLLPDYES